MPITQLQAQALVLAKVGDILPDSGEPVTLATSEAGLIWNTFEAIWESYADKDLIAPRLRLLYSQRDALDMILAALAHRPDVQEGGIIKIMDSQVFKHRQAQRDAVQVEIERVEEVAALAVSGPEIGQIAQTAPIMPADGYALPGTPLDPNDPSYAGSPYSRLRAGRA